MHLSTSALSVSTPAAGLDVDLVGEREVIVLGMKVHQVSISHWCRHWDEPSNRNQANANSCRPKAAS